MCIVVLLYERITSVVTIVQMSDHAVGQNVEETPNKINTRKCTGNSNEKGLHA